MDIALEPGNGRGRDDADETRCPVCGRARGMQVGYVEGVGTRASYVCANGHPPTFVAPGRMPATRFGSYVRDGSGGL